MLKIETPPYLTQPQTPGTGALSPDRAFVVHFYATATGAAIEAGRAEHVRSGQITHFRTWEELATFVTAIIKEHCP